MGKVRYKEYIKPDHVQCKAIYRKTANNNFVNVQSDVNLINLDGVALLITDPPPTSFRNLSEKKKEKLIL